MSTVTYAARDSATMLGRNLKHMLRYPSLTLMLIGQPVLFLLLFVYVFGGTMGAGLPGGSVDGGAAAGRSDYLAYIAPAILIMTVASVALSTAIYIAKDATEGIIDRFRTMPIAQGSVLTNKYAEGYPGKRYYGGCEYVDVIETLAIERAKKLFNCQFANVQPNSGSQMNQAVFLALLNPGDTFMGLDLAAGGHLTHGSPVNMSGKWFKVVPYGVRRDDHLLDMDEIAASARANKPKLIIAGGTAYSRVWDFKRFREIADEVGA